MQSSFYIHGHNSRNTPCRQQAGISGASWWAMPGSQSNSLKILFEHWSFFFHHFHARFFLRSDPFWTCGNSGLLKQDLFFLRRFHMAFSLRADLLEQVIFFFLYFHDSFQDGSLVMRSDSWLGFFNELFLDERWMDFFWTDSFAQWDLLFCFFWDDPFKMNWRRPRFSLIIFQPVPMKRSLEWTNSFGFL